MASVLSDNNTSLSLFCNCRSSNGSFLREILKAEKNTMASTNGIEERALDLVLGDDLDRDILVSMN